MRAALLYGGIGYAAQEAALRSGADVVVGTPGRTLDLVSRRRLTLSRVQLLVLDEGDEMLDAGVAPDVERLLELTYRPQIVLASAIMPHWVDRMIERYVDDPVRIRVGADELSTLEHGLVRVGRVEKLRTLSRLIQQHRDSAIVFGGTKYGVGKLNLALRKLRHGSAGLQRQFDPGRPRPDDGRISGRLGQRPDRYLRGGPRPRHQSGRPGHQLRAA